MHMPFGLGCSMVGKAAQHARLLGFLFFGAPLS